MGKADPTTNKLSKEEIAQALSVVIASKRDRDIIHVISRGDGWGVLREGSRRPHKIHLEKQSAVAHARQLAQRSPNSEVIVHKKDGSPERYIEAK